MSYHTNFDLPNKGLLIMNDYTIMPVARTDDPDIFLYVIYKNCTRFKALYIHYADAEDFARQNEIEYHVPLDIPPNCFENQIPKMNNDLQRFLDSNPVRIIGPTDYTYDKQLRNQK